MEYKIEKDVSLSGRGFGRGKWNNIIKKMKIGDSFKVHDRKEASSFIAALRALGINGALRKKGAGYRVWKLGKKK